MAEPRIEREPRLEAPPDFTSPAYAAIRQAMMQNNEQTDGQAAQALLDAWQNENRARQLRWEQQGEEEREQQLQPEPEDNLPQAEADGEPHPQRVQPQEDQPPSRPASPVPERAEVRETSPTSDKEDTRDSTPKRKLPPLTAGKKISAVQPDQPAPFAIKRLRKFQYVELWYFTKQGCDDAHRSSISTPDDVFTLSTIRSNTVALRPLDESSPSKAVVPDESLSWRDVSIAHKLLLIHMEEQNWPEDYLASLARMFMSLDFHDSRRNAELGDKIIIQYQAEVRREWHKQISAAKAIFDIGEISEPC